MFESVLVLIMDIFSFEGNKVTLTSLMTVIKDRCLTNENYLYYKQKLPDCHSLCAGTDPGLYGPSV